MISNAAKDIKIVLTKDQFSDHKRLKEAFKEQLFTREVTLAFRADATSVDDKLAVEGLFKQRIFSRMVEQFKTLEYAPGEKRLNIKDIKVVEALQDAYAEKLREMAHGTTEDDKKKALAILDNFKSFSEGDRPNHEAEYVFRQLDVERLWKEAANIRTQKEIIMAAIDTVVRAVADALAVFAAIIIGMLAASREALFGYSSSMIAFTAALAVLATRLIIVPAYHAITDAKKGAKA